MIFFLFSVSAFSLKIIINENEYFGDTYEAIIAEYGSTLDTIKSLKITEGLFPLNSISSEYTNLETLEVPTDSFQGNIKDNFFKGRNSLKNIVINGANIVGSNAFESCSNLKNVELINCVTVNQYAFKDCVALEQIDMPKLQQIGKHGFENTGLIEIELNSLKDLPDSYDVAHQFASCQNLEKVTFKCATRLSSHCFYSCTKLTFVDAPLVSDIGSWSFYKCDSFNNFTFPSLNHICQSSFLENPSITQIISDSINSIDAEAFKGCTKLQKAELIECNSIGNSVFENCISLEQINMPKLQQIGKHGFENTGLIEIELNSLKDLPDSYDVAHQFASCQYLEKVTFKCATRLSSHCFYSCTKLTFVDAPLVSDIGSWSFYKCDSFNNLTFPSLNHICQCSFLENPSITQIISDSINSIDAEAFKGCTKLQKAELIECNSIGDSVFENCISLEQIDMPKLQQIGKHGFQNTKLIEIELNSLKELTDSYGIAHQFSTCGRLKRVSMKLLPRVSYGMFESCISLETVELESCTFITEKGFNLCNNIKNVVFGFTDIEVASLPNSRSLVNVYLPNALTIKQGAFYEFRQMTSCKLPLVSTIEEGAFENCVMLNNLEIPRITELIGDKIFLGCENLVSLSMRSLISVDPAAENIFSGCRNLKYISLPDQPPHTFNKIAFQEISSHCEIYIPTSSISIYDDDVSIEGDVKGDNIWCNILLTEHDLVKTKLDKGNELVDRTLFDAFKSYGIKLSEVKEIQIMAGLISQDELKLIKEHFSNLENLIIDSGVSIENKIIPSNFLKDHNQIKFISIQCEVDSIEESAFEGCTQLEVIKCPFVKELKSFCLKGPSLLESISFENVISLKGSNFFSSNSLLETIELPKLSEVIATGFISENSPNIKNIKLPEDPPICSSGTFQFDVNPTLIGITQNAAKRYDSEDGITDMKYYSLSLSYDLIKCVVNGEMVCGITLKSIIPQDATIVEIIDGEISESDFQFPSSISSLTIGENVIINKIHADAFLQQQNLKSVQIYSTNDFQIGENAFFGCSSLETVIINGATILEGNAFKDCSQLRSITLNDIQEMKGNSHFEGCTEIISISLPSLTTIPSSSSSIFLSCSKLSMIRLGSTPPKTINKNSFVDVKYQLKLLLPNENDYLAYDNDESIEGDVQNDGLWCGLSLSDNLIKIKINQQSVIYKGQQLIDCIDSSNIQISSITSLEIVMGNVLVSDLSNIIKELISLETLIVLPTVTFNGDISKLVFTGSKLISITLPQLEVITENCFKNCINLKNVDLYGAKTIKDSAFSGCISLNNIYLPVETFIGDSHFEGCTNLASININKLKTVDPLSENIFNGCSLSYIYLPEIPPKTFNKNTFKNMNLIILGLTEYDLNNYDKNTDVDGDEPDDKKWCGIGLYSLYIEISINDQEPFMSTTISDAIESSQATAVTSITIKGGMVKKSHFNEINEISTLEKFIVDKSAFLESSIIDNEQFNGNNNLKEVKILQKVSLKPSCFKDCTSLVSVEFCEATVICENSFQGCFSLAEIKIPKCKELRGDFIFSGCSSLTEIDFSSLEIVDKFASKIFESCSSLSCIKLPSKEPSTFNKLSFLDCPAIQIQLPYYDDYAKYDDESLIQDDVKEDSEWCGIKIDQAFLPPILTFKINDQEYSGRKINNDPISPSLHLLEEGIRILELCDGLIKPNELKNAIKGCKTLEKFEAQLNTLSEIEAGTFDGCELLNEIIIHPEVIIHPNSLQNIPNLEKLTLNNQKTLRSDEFYNDNKLQEINLPKLTVIPNNLFANLNELHSVNLNDASIMLQDCFMNCGFIESIDLPNIKIMYGDSHFEGCSNLKKIDLSSLISVDQESSNIFKNCLKLNELKLGNEPPKTFNENVFSNSGKIAKISIPDEKSWKNYFKQSVVNEENNHYVWYGYDIGIEHNENDDCDCPECPSQVECPTQVECPDPDEGGNKSNKSNKTTLLISIILGLVVVILIIVIVVISCKKKRNYGSENEASDI